MILIVCSSLLLILVPSEVGFVLSYGELGFPELFLLSLETSLHSSFSIPDFLLLVSLRETVNLSLHLIPEFLVVE